MDIPITGVSMFTGAVVFLSAWWYVGYRAKVTGVKLFRPIQLFREFFLYMGLFLAISSLAHLWLIFAPEQFPMAAAIAFTVSHIFTYLALIALARMSCALIPRLAKYEKPIVITLVVISVLVTLLTAKTMIWGTLPVYDYAHGVTINNASRPVGAAIGLMNLVTIVPVLVMFSVFAWRSSGHRRIRSALLAAGMAVLVVSGFMHNVVRTGNVYAFADFLTIVGVFILGAGVLYRMEQSMAPTPAAMPVVAPSNTV